MSEKESKKPEATISIEHIVTIGRLLGTVPNEVLVVALFSAVERALFGDAGANTDEEKGSVALKALSLVKKVAVTMKEERKQAKGGARAMEFTDALIARTIKSAKEEVAKSKLTGEGTVISLPDGSIRGPGSDTIN